MGFFSEEAFSFLGGGGKGSVSVHCSDGFCFHSVQRSVHPLNTLRVEPRGQPASQPAALMARALSECSEHNDLSTDCVFLPD